MDTANLLFAHVPGTKTITFDVARGRAAHLRRRLDDLHKETVLGLKQEPRPGTSRPAVRPNSPPRPGTSTDQALTAAHWSWPVARSASPCHPGVTLSSALTASQLTQIKAYLQGQQLLPEDRSNEETPASASTPASTSAKPAAEPLSRDLFNLPLLPSYRNACLLYTSPSPRD